MQLYAKPCHAVSAEIAVAMAVPIENPADCEVRGVIRFVQADEISGYLAEEASSRVELFCCTSAYCPADTNILREKLNWDILGHPPYNPDLAPSDFFLISKMKEHLATIAPKLVYGRKECDLATLLTPLAIHTLLYSRK